MQELQPELKKIKDKYKDDAKKQQEETMKLFQKEGVNPLAGCFPILIQMPILIALYAAIMRNGHIGEHTFLWMQLGTKDPYYILPLLAAVTTYLQQKNDVFADASADAKPDDYIPGAYLCHGDEFCVGPPVILGLQ